MDLWTYGPMDLWTILGNWETGKRFTISMRTMHCAPTFCCRPRSVATAYSRPKQLAGKTHRPIDLWTYGLMDLWTYGLMDLWTISGNWETVHPFHFHAHKALCAYILLQTPQCGDGL